MFGVLTRRSPARRVGGLAVALAAALCLAAGAGSGAAAATYPNPDPISGSTFAHDPSMIRTSSGRYYLFYTGGGIEISTSTDRTAWSSDGQVLPNGATWAMAYGGWNDTVRAGVGAAGWRYLVMWDVDMIDWKLESAGGPTAADMAAKLRAEARGGCAVGQSCPGCAGSCPTAAATGSRHCGCRRSGSPPVGYLRRR